MKGTKVVVIEICLVTMKKTFGKCLLLGLFMAFSSLVSAQSWEGGIVVSNQDESTITYQFKVVGMDSPIKRDRLESALEGKEGIYDAQVSVVTRICTVQGVKALKPRHLADVVEMTGFEVQKNFQEQ